MRFITKRPRRGAASLPSETPRDEVEDAGHDSFPASDAPGFSQPHLTTGGPPPAQEVGATPWRPAEVREHPDSDPASRAAPAE